MGVWVGGWMDGWMGVKVVLRIAYSKKDNNVQLKCTMTRVISVFIVRLLFFVVL